MLSDGHLQLLGAHPRAIASFPASQSRVINPQLLQSSIGTLRTLASTHSVSAVYLGASITVAPPQYARLNQNQQTFSDV